MKYLDRLLLALIIAMLAINTTIDTVGNQHIEDSVEKTDIIAQCLDPNSDCAKLTAERDKREREYLEKLMRVTNVCVLHANRLAAGQPLEAVVAVYDQCVDEGAPPPPTPINEKDRADETR